MTMKKLLGISLGLVMLIGSIPLGFSEPMNLTDGMAITDSVEINKHTVPKSLYKQIQSGVSQNELVCANTNHVLAERSNGNLACVSERTADRMNWQKVTFTATIDDVLLDNIESQENDKATQETVEISDEKILLTPELEGHTSQGISKYPYFNIEVPSQVAKGEPFDVKATWSWVIYETDEDGNIIYDRDSGLPIIEDSASLDYERQRASERSIEDRKIGIFSVSGAELLDSDFTLIDFDDEVPILGYGKESTVYSLDIMYDESKVHEKNISFQIDEIIETRNAIQVGLVHGVQYILYLYEDNGVITLETEQRQDFINYMSEQYKKTDYKEKFYEDMKADYQNRGLSVSDIPLKHIPKDYMDRPDKLSDELREQLKEFHEPTPEQEQRIKELHLNKTESDFPETRELIQSQNLTEVKDIIRYLGTNNYHPDFIDKFLRHFHNQTTLETQSFQNPLSYFILPNAFAQTDNSTNPHVPDLDKIKSERPDEKKKFGNSEHSIRTTQPHYLPPRSGITYDLYDENGEEALKINVSDVSKFEWDMFDFHSKDYRPEMKAKAQSFGIDTTKPMIDYESPIDPYTQRDVYFIKKYLGQTMSTEEIGKLQYKFGLIFGINDELPVFPDFVTVMSVFPSDEELGGLDQYPDETKAKLVVAHQLRYVTILAPLDRLYDLEKLDYYGFIKSSPSVIKKYTLDEAPVEIPPIPTHLQYNPDRFVSPKQQIANGVLPFEVQCNEGLELAMKHDGLPVCVSVDSIDRLEQRNYLSEKMNWQVIETFEETVQINYDFPLSSKDYPQVNANSETSMYFGEFDVTLTNLPEVGETAEVIVNFVADIPILESEGYVIGISLSDEFEFVDVPEDEIVYDTSILSRTGYHKPLVLAVGESAQLSATIKAVKEGMGDVGGTATYDHFYRYGVFVGEEPMLREDYYELYPELEPTMEMPDPSDDVEPTPKEHPAPRPETEPETSSTNSTSPSNPTDDEIREQLRENGLDEELIEEMIKHRNEQRNQTETQDSQK